MTPWWTLPPDEVAKAFGVDPATGLSVPTAERRLAEHGPNELAEGPPVQAWGIFIRQFKGLVIWVLIAAAVVSGLLREWLDASAILAIVGLNGILGFLQEFHAEKSLAALKKLSTPTARVLRDGTRHLIPAKFLVPGDIVELEAGDHVPADGRLLSVVQFQTQEAALTGESASVSKEMDALADQDRPIGDRLNMVFLGTSAAAGKARFLVTATGMATELGHIARLLQTTERESTPLQQRLEGLGRWLVYLCGGIVTIVFFLGKLRGVSTLEMFLTSVSLAVAAIPEGLPAVVTIALAVGVQHMVRRKALIRKLPAVETLGCTTVICSDKTGTLTQNNMSVRQIWSGGVHYTTEGSGYNPAGRILREDGAEAGAAPDLQLTLRIGVLCNNAELLEKDRRWEVLGDPTEGALLTAAAKAGLIKDVLEAKEPLLLEIPFDSSRKRMTTLRKTGVGARVYMKGAPDVILKLCRAWLKGGAAETLSSADRDRLLQTNERFGQKGWRVLAMAYRDLDRPPEGMSAERIETELVFAGMEAMQDPPHPEAIDAIARCHAAGIRTVMITGDHAVTAAAIAREMGLLQPGQKIFTGTDLDRLDDAALVRAVPQVAVYARVSPEHKLRVVRAWQAQGEVVAMTGDGVNDAPALKEADIGVAMGMTGTAVTQEAADMVVLDDNFATIAAAVEEGRGIYENIRKFVFYLLSCNTGEVLVMLLASLSGLPIPLLPIQILWINLLTDSLPALALGLDPYSKNLMERPARRRDEAIITRGTFAELAGVGILIAVLTLTAFVWTLRRGPEGLGRARSMAFFVLATTQLAHAFNSRSERESLFRLGWFANRWLWGAVLISLGLQLAVTYWPPAQAIFKTQALSMTELAIAIGGSLLMLVFVELAKWLRRINRYRSRPTARADHVRSPAR